MIGRTCTSDEAGITTGRFVSVCGAIGVSSIASTAGCTIGPPAARLYAVDPVGLAMIKPSARTRVTGSSPTITEISMMRDSAPFVITMSLSTMCSANG